MKRYLLIVIIGYLQFSSGNIFSQNIVFVKPNYLIAGERTNITITGINTKFTKIPALIDSAYSTLIQPLAYYSGIYVKSYKIINDTAMTLDVSTYSGIGYRNLIFYDKSDKKNPITYFRANAVLIKDSRTKAPNITITPSRGEAGQMLEVSIVGTNTDFIHTGCYSGGMDFEFGFPGKYNSTGGGLAVMAVDIRDETHMKIKGKISETALTGYQDFGIWDWCDGYWSQDYFKTNAFYIKNNLNPPQIKKLVPSYANRNQILEVSVIGSNTKFTEITKAASGSAEFIDYMKYYINDGNNDINVNNFKIINDTLINLNMTVLPFARTGLRDFRAYVSKKTLCYNKYNVFSIGPRLSSINPETANRGESKVIEINCENINFYNNDIRYFKVWLYTIYSERVEEIFAKRVEVKSSSILTATFDIPTDAFQGFWFVNVVDNVDGYFYQPDILEIGQTLGINEISQKNELKVFPNPCSDKFTIEYNAKSSDNTTLEIYNLSGKKIVIKNYGIRAQGMNKIEIKGDEYSLKEGVYILKLSSAKDEYYTKINYLK